MNGLRHGKGKIYYKNDNIAYDGDFVKRKFEGNGKYIYEDGSYYIGQYLNGLKHGKGIEYYKNGDIRYEGLFVKGNYEGNGKYLLFFYNDLHLLIIFYFYLISIYY